MSKPFEGFHIPNTTPVPDIVCWICQQPHFYRIGLRKNGGFTSQLCSRCYDEIVRRVGRQRKRARLEGVAYTLTSMQWIAILYNSQGYCYYCHQFIGFTQLTMEHVRPIALGGGTTAENCVPACLDCNIKHWTKRGGVV